MDVLGRLGSQGGLFPRCVVLWLVGLLTGFNFFVLSLPAVAQIPSGRNSRLNSAVGELSRRAKFADRSVVPKRERFAVKDAENVAVGNFTVNFEERLLSIGDLQLVERPQLRCIKNVFRPFRLRSQVSFTPATYREGVAHRTTKAVAVTETKRTSFIRKCFNRQVASCALSTIRKVNHDDGFTISSSLWIELREHAISGTKIHVRPLCSFEIGARLIESLIKVNRLEDYASGGNRTEYQQPCVDWIADVPLAATQQISRALVIVFFLGVVFAALLAVHFADAEQPFVSVIFCVLTFLLALLFVSQLASVSSQRGADASSSDTRRTVGNRNAGSHLTVIL